MVDLVVADVAAVVVVVVAVVVVVVAVVVVIGHCNKTAFTHNWNNQRLEQCL